MTWTMRLVAMLLVTATATAVPAQSAVTTNPHGPAIGACAACHGPTGWRPARISRDFVHAPGRFALDGAHARTACTACHASLDFAKAPAQCAQCHRDVHKSELGTECAQCHTTRSFVDQTNVKRLHELTRFPLRGAHATLDCASCHPASQPGQSQYRRRPTSCIGCHSATYRAARAPDHQAAGFTQDCTQCHSSTSWRGGTFDHQTTRFALAGAHASVSCDGCHGDGVFRGKATACTACHQDDYTWSKQPPHAASGFPTDCTMCHSVKAWKGATFNHDVTAFALTGAHRAALCSGCHGDGVFEGKPTACASCHQREYTASVRPPHASLAFSTSCAACHTTAAWAGGAFDHGTTAFALTGAHRTATCGGCHADGTYRARPSACASCHQASYDAAKNPPHAASGFPATCQQCHGTSSWLGSSFDHSSTAFPLTGAHRAATCTNCHGDGVFKGKATACVACHQRDYSATATPPHAASGFGTTCQQCHTTAAWLGSGFDHSVTAFPLAGAHKAAACTACHGDGVYKGKSTACATCHLPKYTAARTPPHAGFPTTCQSCHGVSTWTGASFDHALTLFALTGAHRTVACMSCHTDNVYKGRNTACIACHQPAYTAANRPPHLTLAFPTVCTNCHTTGAWAGGLYDHATTRFALTGAHRAVSCNGCHGDGVYRGKSMLCAACHQGRFDAALAPNHKTSGFPTTCEVCHGTATWTPATFNHSATRFPLTGAHVTQACASCHGDGVYRGKTTLCSGCHLARYNATTNPVHKAANFPTTCESCHTTTRWTGATFNHDGTYFPIYSGKHKGRWSTCADCHTVSTNYKSFSCFSCHRQTEMDSKHRGRTGYRYDSVLCYQCHPQGRS